MRKRQDKIHLQEVFFVQAHQTMGKGSSLRSVTLCDGVYDLGTVLLIYLWSVFVTMDFAILAFVTETQDSIIK